MSLPSLAPAPKTLPLTSLDLVLAEGSENAAIPPRNWAECCLVCHVGIRQAVYIGTHLLDSLCETPPVGVANIPMLMLYRHVLDLGDSIGTLLRFGSASTASILLRALFETYLSLKFILEGNTFHQERANCYWAYYRIKQLKAFNICDPSTEAGREYHKILDADPVLKDANFPRKDHSKERETIQGILAQESYKPFWNRYKKEKQKAKYWYALCSTASNLRELAKLVGSEAEYIVLYGYLSQTVHGSDVLTDVLRFSPKEGARIHQIRGPENRVQTVASLAATYLLYCNQSILQTYFQKEHNVYKAFLAWYLVYRPFYQWVITPGQKITSTEQV